jgi:hypothetical protein
MYGMPRHHTVPEVYLKGFFDPAKVALRQNVLWLYEENRKIRPRGADAVAAVEGFNLDHENDPGKEDLAEKMYAKLEEAARPVLEKLRAGDPRLTEEEKVVFSYFIGFQKFRTTWYRETVNSAGVDEFRHTCQRILDEDRVHEFVGTSEAERSGRVNFSHDDAERFIRDMADGATELTQTSKGFALGGALEGGQMLTPRIAGVHWTLCEASASEPWITTDNPVALFEPFPGRRKPGVYGPSLQFLFPISPRFLLFGEPMTHGPDDRGRVSARIVRMFTDDLLRIAHRQVYASIFSKELQSRVNRVFKQRGKVIVPMPANFGRS